jgi:hypothetical protein
VKRKVKSAVFLLMIALLPLRALAAVTTGFCTFAHDHGVAAQHGSAHQEAHGHGGPAHSHDTSPCNSCIEHCSSAALAASAVVSATVFVPVAGERPRLAERSPAGFIPDHLDPPPLAA